MTEKPRLFVGKPRLLSGNHASCRRTTPFCRKTTPACRRTTPVRPIQSLVSGKTGIPGCRMCRVKGYGLRDVNIIRFKNIRTDVSVFILLKTIPEPASFWDRLAILVTSENTAVLIISDIFVAEKY